MKPILIIYSKYIQWCNSGWKNIKYLPGHLTASVYVSTLSDFCSLLTPTALSAELHAYDWQEDITQVSNLCAYISQMYLHVNNQLHFTHFHHWSTA